MRFNCITGLAVEIYFEKNGRLALMAGHPSEKGFKDGKRARCASIASRGWRWSATAACSCATTNHSVRCITLLHSGIFGTCQECQQQSLVRTGNLQLYAPQVFFVIPIGRILCRQKSCVFQSHRKTIGFCSELRLTRIYLILSIPLGLSREMFWIETLFLCLVQNERNWLT